MTAVIVWSALGLPFAFLYGPPAVANIAAFVFWVFWIVALLSVPGCMWQRAKINHDRAPWPFRLFFVLATWSGLIALVAYGHFAMASVALVTLVMVRLQKDRQLAAEKSWGKHENH